MSGIEQEQGGDGRPEWLPEKFKSPEEMSRSYTEAEQRILQLQSEVDRQREEFSTALSNLGEASRQETPQRFDPGSDPLIAQYQAAVDNGDAQAMLAIQLELQRQITAQEVGRFQEEVGGRIDRGAEVEREIAITMATERVARNYENWEELAPKIGSFLQERPHWIPERASVEAFETAISEAANVITAREVLAGRDIEERDRQAKLAAQGLQGNGGRVPTPEESQAEWEKIRNAQLGGYAGIMGQRSGG